MFLCFHHHSISFEWEMSLHFVGLQSLFYTFICMTKSNIITSRFWACLCNKLICIIPCKWNNRVSYTENNTHLNLQLWGWLIFVQTDILGFRTSQIVGCFPHINTGNKVLLLMWQTGRSWWEGASVLDESDPGPEEMTLQPKQETGNRKQAPCQEVYHPDNNRAQCGVWWQRWASEKSRLEYFITSD